MQNVKDAAPFSIQHFEVKYHTILSLQNLAYKHLYHDQDVFAMSFLITRDPITEDCDPMIGMRRKRRGIASPARPPHILDGQGNVIMAGRNKIHLTRSSFRLSSDSRVQRRLVGQSCA